MTSTAHRVAAGVIALAVLPGCYSASPERAIAAADALRQRHERGATLDALAAYTAIVDGSVRAAPRVRAEAAAGAGAAYEQLGRLVESLDAYEKALAFAAQSSEPSLQARLHSHVGVAQALAADRPQSLTEAERHCRTGLELARRVNAIDEQAAAHTCLGEVSYSGGALSEALGHYADAETIASRSGDARTVAQAQLAQGWVHSDLGDFPAATKCFEDAASKWTVLGERRQLAITRVAQARLRLRRGEYDEALRAFDQATALLEPMGDAVWLGGSLTGKAEVFRSTADVTQALALWEQALTVFEEAGLRTVQVDVLRSAAATMLASGDEIGALRGFRRAQTLAVELGNSRWQAWISEGVASVYIFQKKPGEARSELERVRALLPQVGDKGLEASVLADIGQVHDLLNEPEQAREYYERAVAASLAASDRVGAARHLFSRGVAEARLGNLPSAHAVLTEALTERQRLFGATHPIVAETRMELASLDFARGAASAAMGEALDAEEVSRTYLRQTLRYLPERQALTLASRRTRGLDLALSILASGARAQAARVFAEVVASRGLVLEELAARRRVQASRDARVAPLSERLLKARRRFANLLVRSDEDSVARKMLDEARTEMEQAERALAAESALARDELTRVPATLDQIRRALPERAVLVSFVQYAQSPIRTRSGNALAAPVNAFAAFVLRSASPRITVIPLGSLAEIEGLIARWRAEAAGRSLLAGIAPAQAERSLQDLGVQLRRTIWDPLAEHVRGASRVFLVPDGAIALVPLAALPSSSGAYLLEPVPPIHYLTTERDLLSPGNPAKGLARGMLAVGGPAFDGPLSSSPGAAVPARSGGPTADREDAPRPQAVTCGNLQNIRFDTLPGTLEEVEDLSRIFQSARASHDDIATVLTGSRATERAITDDAHRYQVVHLATHGFFLGAACAPQLPGRRGVGGLATGNPGENPLLLSGLALAGANRRAQAKPDEDDGILTAEEVASLDLSGTEWAVLSACDTGVGEIKAGEGVFGLRRAFQVAGARTVIMSLWSVEDQSTRAWMRALYEARFQRHLSTADAVHQASLSVLRDRRVRGLSTHPFFWAAFVAAGDWR